MIERFMLNEELEKRVCEITGVDYTGMLKLEDIENIIKDLIIECDRAKEKFDDLKENVDNNYEEKKIEPYEEYGINPKDFY